jgi:hypothetical protein
VLELEFGTSAAARQQSLQGLLKFGLLRDLELDWAGNPWRHDAPLNYAGVSDDSTGFRWRFLHQAKRKPTLTVQYSIKLPTAGPVEGSGEVDHIVTLLASKDLPARFHLDANLSYQWLVRPRGGFDHNWLPAFTLGYSLTDKWGVAMEFSGATRANAAAAAVTQNLWAVSYTVKPRLVLDCAVQFRVTGSPFSCRLTPNLRSDAVFVGSSSAQFANRSKLTSPRCGAEAQFLCHEGTQPEEGVSCPLSNVRLRSGCALPSQH